MLGIVRSRFVIWLWERFDWTRPQRVGSSSNGWSLRSGSHDFSKIAQVRWSVCWKTVSFNFNEFLRNVYLIFSVRTSSKIMFVITKKSLFNDGRKIFFLNSNKPANHLFSIVDVVMIEKFSNGSIVWTDDQTASNDEIRRCTRIFNFKMCSWFVRRFFELKLLEKKSIRFNFDWNRQTFDRSSYQFPMRTSLLKNRLPRKCSMCTGTIGTLA